MYRLSLCKLSNVFAAIVAAASFSSATYGQSLRTPLQVDVPFAFVSGDQHLDHGRYTFWLESDHVTAVRGASHADFAMSDREDDLQPAKESKIVFKKYGDQYFLSQVWVAGMKAHVRCLETEAEKKARSADISTAPHNVDLALVEAKQ